MMKQLKAWWHNARPTSLMQSMMPACLAVVVVFSEPLVLL